MPHTTFVLLAEASQKGCLLETSRVRGLSGEVALERIPLKSSGKAAFAFFYLSLVDVLIP